MKPVEVEAESLRYAARNLTNVAQDADGTLQSFEGEISSLGEPWGDDDLGMIIGTVYQAALAAVMNCLNSNLETVDSLSERLGVAADQYDDTDTGASEALNQVRDSEPNVAI